MAFLDETGLTTLWSIIKGKYDMLSGSGDPTTKTPRRYWTVIRDCIW